MASPRTLAWIERLAWVCLYGGVIVVILGLSTLRYDALQASVLLTGGGLAVVGGVVLILLRSRLRADPPPPRDTPSHG
jgi:hypothetical protein